MKAFYWLLQFYEVTCYKIITLLTLNLARKLHLSERHAFEWASITSLRVCLKLHTVNALNIIQFFWIFQNFLIRRVSCKLIRGKGAKVKLHETSWQTNEPARSLAQKSEPAQTPLFSKYRAISGISHGYSILIGGKQQVLLLLSQNQHWR